MHHSLSDNVVFFFFFFFMNAPLVCKRVKSLFFLSTSAAKNKISHLEVLVEI